MRKMATLRRIDSISPIQGADAIEVATVGGWKVVVKKGEFSAGELAVYCEIDSFIPHQLAPFLTKSEKPKEFDGILGERLRSIKLRGQISQGLLLKTDCEDNSALKIGDKTFPCIENYDVSDILNVKKWEPPVPAQLTGVAKGSFPSFLRKTDQERVQNLKNELFEWRKAGFTWEVTEKLDGSSMTVYWNNGNFGVCSRNLDLKEDDNNSFWQAARNNQLFEKLSIINRNIAIQGELIGEGIQKNRYGLKGQKFLVFDIYDIDQGEYMRPTHRIQLCDRLELSRVPQLFSHKEFSGDIDEILKFAEGTSVLYNIEREGVVFKCNESELSFKAISNKFLLKGGQDE